MNQNKKIYKTEREGQIEFFDNYGIPWEENDGVLVENCDGVYNGVLFEFKLNINVLILKLMILSPKSILTAISVKMMRNVESSVRQMALKLLVGNALENLTTTKK